MTPDYHQPARGGHTQAGGVPWKTDAEVLALVEKYASGGMSIRTMATTIRCGDVRVMDALRTLGMHTKGKHAETRARKKALAGLGPDRPMPQCAQKKRDHHSKQTRLERLEADEAAGLIAPAQWQRASPTPGVPDDILFRIPCLTEAHGG